MFHTFRRSRSLTPRQIKLAEEPTLIADYDSMEIPLDGRRGRTLLLVSIAVAAILIWQASVLWLARHRLESGNLTLMMRGIALTPGDGAGWDRIGQLRQSNYVNSNISEAIKAYRKAVVADPRSPHYWLDLATAYEVAGDNARAQDAFAHAKAASPLSAEVAFSYGNFLMRNGNYAQAYQELQRAVRSDPKLLPLAISRTWRASEDIDQLNQTLPATGRAYLQAIDFFVSTHQMEPALTEWRRLIALGEPVSLASTFPFLDELIHEDRADDARRVWREAVAAAGLPQPESTGRSLIWNGDFRQEFANGGLGWRWSPLQGVTIDFDSQPGPEGSRALRLDFSGGSNVNLGTPLEFVPVRPQTDYHFHASMRTQEITTESGLRFSIIDPNHPNAVNVVTDNFTGTHAWTDLDADLATGAETHFLLIRLIRAPSRLFDNHLGGTVWIAGISLVPSGTQAERAPQ
jgi:tetratricopeptide (TPR) repeat protein